MALKKFIGAVFAVVGMIGLFRIGYSWGTSNASLQHAETTKRKEDKLALESELSVTTTTTTKAKHFALSDCRAASPPAFFQRSASGSAAEKKAAPRCQRMPRVVIETWCTANMMPLFVNEVYWKSCYAHAHGFDVLFTGVRPNVSGVKMYEKSSVEGSEDNKVWYSDENMWAWIPIVKDLLLSGKYDYVWHVGGDVLIQEINLNFPVWAWDRGHDITVMDQPYNEWGLNQNALLFRATKWSIKFLDTLYAHRRNFNLQGDNGPYMETILYHLGKERKAKMGNQAAYNDSCWPLLVQDKPSASIIADDVQTGKNTYGLMNEKYAKCFFDHLDRYAGAFGFRDSTHIGFSNTLRKDSLPWANCWSLVRSFWSDWQYHCFALHWNGIQKTLNNDRKVQGKCPDPSFDWAKSPYLSQTMEA